MCQIFAGQDPVDYKPETRSVRLRGFSTSIRLEAAFWARLERIAAREGTTLPQFLATLYDEVQELHGDVRNFASLLRSACLLDAERGPEIGSKIGAASPAA